MRIAQIAPGLRRIPPRVCGPVENIIWHYQTYLSSIGHQIDVYNTPMIHEVLLAVSLRAYDFVHCHCESFVLHCCTHLQTPFALTSHDSNLARYHPGVSATQAYDYLFADCLKAPAILAPSRRSAETYAAAGYRGFLRVLRHGVECSRFRPRTAGNGRSICLGRICARKRQAWVAEAARGRAEIDFVGPWNRSDASNFKVNETASYLGEWDRETVYERLSEYSCLVLLSESEVAPLAVLEALAAGLSVVISKSCTANLQFPKDFIHVVPDGEMRPGYVAAVISACATTNGQLRPEIVAHARERFDYPVVMNEYLEIIREYLDGCEGCR